MNEDEIKRMARKSGMTPREYCLEQIAVWKDRLQLVSDDYLGMSDNEFDQMVEREVDSYTENER